MGRLKGFTIVELLIVVVVIAILAAVTIVAYNGIQSRAQISTLQSDISQAVRAMEVAKTVSPDSTYPSLFPDNVKASAGVGLSLSASTKGFCVNGQTLKAPVKRWYRDASSTLQEGVCPGAVIADSEVGMPKNLVRDTNFETPGWFASASHTSLANSVRVGLQSDPLPGRPVFVISSTPNASVTWAYMGGVVAATQITAGETYFAKYYVRRASGVYSSELATIGVKNGDSSNTAIINAPTGIYLSDDTWREVSQPIQAVANGIAANRLYLGVATSQIKAGSFVLEFQGFEISKIP